MTNWRDGMVDQKQKITVRVGDPELVPSRFRFGTGQTIYIENTETFTPRHGTLKSLVTKLIGLQEKYRDRYEDMAFEEVHDCGCYHDCQCSPTLYLTGKRYETDIEQQLRLDEAAHQAKEQKIRDEAELAAIANRLGKTVV